MSDSDFLPIREEFNEEHKKPKGFLNKTGWIFFGIASFLFFSVAKFPEAKIKAFIQAELTSQLSRMGIQLSSANSDLSLLFGVSYEMTDVRLFFPKSSQPLKIEALEFSPSLSSILFGKLGGTVDALIGGGELNLSFSGDKDGKKINLSFDADSVDFGKAKILNSISPVNGSFILNANGDLEGNPRNIQSMSGHFDFKISKFQIPPQKITIQGLFFSPEIPSVVKIQDGQIQGHLKKGKLFLKKATLGNPKGKKSDLYFDASGEINLNQIFSNSELNMNVKFAIFGSLQKSFGLLDTLLKSYKRSDGSFAYRLKGPINRPIATPLK